jgi:hypothetical protein
MDIVSGVFYKHAKYQYETLYMGYRSTVLSFLCSSKYGVFEIDILHPLATSRFFSFFLKLVNIIFDIVLTGSVELGSQKSPLRGTDELLHA